MIGVPSGVEAVARAEIGERRATLRRVERRIAVLDEGQDPDAERIIGEIPAAQVDERSLTLGEHLAGSVGGARKLVDRKGVRDVARFLSGTVRRKRVLAEKRGRREEDEITRVVIRGRRQRDAHVALIRLQPPVDDRQTILPVSAALQSRRTNAVQRIELIVEVVDRLAITGRARACG